MEILDIVQNIHTKNLVKIPSNEHFRPLMSPRKKPCLLVALWQKSNKLFKGGCGSQPEGAAYHMGQPPPTSHCPKACLRACLGAMGRSAGAGDRPRTAVAVGRRKIFPATGGGGWSDTVRRFPDSCGITQSAITSVRVRRWVMWQDDGRSTRYLRKNRATILIVAASPKARSRQ